MTDETVSRRESRLFNQAVPFGAIAVSILGAITLAYVSGTRPLTALESVLLQSFTLLAGFIGSFLLGRRSARDAAREVIKPHARSAFRRVLTLYSGLARLAYSIEERRSSDEKHSLETSLEVFAAIVNEQIATANDAIEDWRDLVPEDVAELEARLRQNGPTLREEPEDV